MKLLFIIRFQLSVLFLCTLGQLCFSQSVLQSGTYFKLGVEKDGVYKITHELLKKMGITPGEVNPAHIRIFGNNGGMLPQSNDISRPNDLMEAAIFVNGESDGKFDKDDFILFYGEGPYAARFQPEQNIFYYGNNLYSDKNFYFLTISDTPGKRITNTPSLEGTYPLVTSVDDFVYHEIDKINVRGTGREWYGEPFGLTTELVLKFDIPGIMPGSEIKIVSDVLGQSYADASFRLHLNNVQVAEQIILPIVSSTYSIKGYDKRDTITINEGSVSAASRTEQEIKYQFMKASGYSQGYLDYLLVSFERIPGLYSDQTIFTSASSLSNPISTFQLVNATENVAIWDITDPHNITNQDFSLSASTATFSINTETLKKFIIFNEDVPTAEFIKKIEAQNLHGLATPSLIIVSHPLFLDEAKRLADHRSNFSNLTSVVVTPEQIYNEFSSGRQDVSAIRDFVKMLYDKSPVTLKSLLLFGKGSYDYKDRINDNTNFVATYESRNSLHPLQTYSSDDYYGFLESGEGEWAESSTKNHTLDIGVGRLPVTTVEQARSVVDKLIDYDTDKKNLGYWRKEIAFVADDGSNSDGWTSLHQLQANNLASLIEQKNEGFDTKKLFMGTYRKAVSAGSETAPELTNDIVRAFEKGALIINYTGHGSERIWADEAVFTDEEIFKLDNDIYPFLVTATCEFGRHDDPTQTSSAELCVTVPNAGAIGMVTTTRPVNATTNFNLNVAFYEALFQRTNNAFPSIGEVFRNTKNNSLSGVSNRNFSLLCDPSLTLALPPDVIQVTSVKTNKGSDTLKALSRVIVSGYIENANGEKLNDFNGTLEAALFDKETDFETIGRNKPAFTYKEWHNILFRGKATVSEGNFQFEFILPKNISYTIGEGKLSLYAYDSEHNYDANGVSKSFKIGGGETSYEPDTKPPEISLFIGDTTFLNGGITTPDTWLVANLFDESGINISDYGIGNSLIALLDNDVETFVLNGYYVANTDDFSRGTIRFPLRGLSPGKHTLVLKAWDVFNNPAEATIEFTVTDGQQLIIESFGAYPNPTSENATFFFTHNRSGEDLEAQLFIYSSTGVAVQATKIPVLESEYRVELMEMTDLLAMRDFNRENKKLPAGIYLARLIVRSLANGSKNEQVTKLIILN